jgi:hypothetical protein
MLKTHDTHGEKSEQFNGAQQIRDFTNFGGKKSSMRLLAC